MTTTLDWCGLCPYPLSKHTVMTEPVRLPNGRKGVRPIGWQCPPPPEPSGDNS